MMINLYFADLPETKARKFIYANHIAITVQHKSKEFDENNLNVDLSVMEPMFPLRCETACLFLLLGQFRKHLWIMYSEANLRSFPQTTSLFTTVIIIC